MDNLANVCRTTSDVPQIKEPLPSPAEATSPMPGSSKSRLRLLFTWRKSSNHALRPNTRTGDEYAQDPLISKDLGQRPPLTPRSQSDNPQPPSSERLHSSDGHLRRKRERVVVDPPPLAQAQGQAILHASLETPLSFTDKHPSRRGSVQDSLPRDVVEEAIAVKRSHKRSESGASNCSTRQAMFFLVNGPYLLQYKDDAEADALPEKILVLDKDCVAFACDVVPGRAWVLQISKTSSRMPTKNHTQSLRPSWSRLTLRQAEDKRTVNTMLLVFNDSEELYTWLFAVRKEIEHLGGLEYCPDTEHNDQSWRENLERKFASISDGDCEPTKTPAVNHLNSVTPPISSATQNDAVKVLDERRASTESLTSSKQSSTSLDRLRDSLASDGYTSTLATSSADGSAPSTSPLCEEFPSIGAVTDYARGQLYLRTWSMNSGNALQQSKPLTPKRSGILERRKLSVNSLKLEHEERRSRKVLPDLPPTISGSPNDVSPKDTEQAQYSGSVKDDSVEQTSIDRSEGVNVEKSLPFRAGQHNCHSGISHELPKPKYSLFPAQSTVEARLEHLVSPKVLVPPQPKSNTPQLAKLRSEQDLKSGRYVSKDAKHKKSRSRTVTLELRQHRVSALLTTGEFALPQRSPAVTDDMIMSNFGVAMEKPPASPLPVIKVPGLNDLAFDLDFLKKPYNYQTRSTTAETKRGSNARSISSIQSDASTAVPKMPAGPPPAGPLPAVPDLNRDSPRTSRSSQLSAHSQQSKTRRSGTSTKPELKQDYKNDPPLSTSPERTMQVFSQVHTVNCQQPLHRHRRTISGSVEGPPPPDRTSSRASDTTRNIRTRSRSRGRRKSNKSQCQPQQ